MNHTAEMTAQTEVIRRYVKIYMHYLCLYVHSAAFLTCEVNRPSRTT